MRVLYVSHSAGLYGAETSLLTLLRSLDRERFEPLVVLPDEEGPLFAEVEQLGVRAVRMPLDRWIRFPWDRLPADGGLVRTVERLRALIAEERVALVHTNTSVNHEAALAARAAGVPHVWHVRELLPENPELAPVLPLRTTLQTLARLSAAVVTVSAAGQAQFRAAGVTNELHTIPNGAAPFSGTAEDRAAVRADLGADDSEVLALTLGEVTDGKGYPQLLEAAARVRDAGAPVRFAWAGPIPDTSLDRDGAVRLLGFRRDVPALLAAADLVIVPSLRESFSRVAIEAMAAARPVIATRCGGPEEIVIPGGTGLLVPVDDPDALAAAILDLASSPARREQFGAEAARVFAERFSAAQHARAIEALYDAVLAPPAPGAPNDDPGIADTFATYTALVTLAEELRRTRETLAERERDLAAALQPPPPPPAPRRPHSLRRWIRRQLPGRSRPR